MRPYAGRPTTTRRYLSATLTPVLCDAHGAPLLTDANGGDTVVCANRTVYTHDEEDAGRWLTPAVCTLSVSADILPKMEDGESLADAPHPDHGGAYVLAHLTY